MAQKEHNPNCKSDLHSQHLCYIISQGFHLTEAGEYKAITQSPKFKCRHCGRTAGDKKNLCEPVSIKA